MLSDNICTCGHTALQHFAGAGWCKMPACSTLENTTYTNIFNYKSLNMELKKEDAKCVKYNIIHDSNIKNKFVK